jgi:cyclohexanone monooxygenase
MPHQEKLPKTEGLVDAVVIGAGFAGLYMLHKLRELGLTVRGFEAADDVGGVWHWNRYPGARCDVESMQYSYSFSDDLQQDWQWTERFARQPEILRYIHHVADRFDLRRDICFSTRVLSAAFDEAEELWDIRTDRGERTRARFCIMATGSLSVAKVPELPGLADFRGECFHTGDWPEGEVDFRGRRVGIIGTGSSGIQAIPIIAEQAGHLTVFQRTPSFVVPARNRPMDAETEQYWKDNYAEHRCKARDIGTFYDFSETLALSVPEDERQRQYARRWQEGGVNFVHSFKDLFVDRAANETAAEFVRARIRETVQDPAVAEVLMPRDYPIGTKRICIGSGYYETFNRPNVTLVDLRATPIREITATGLRTDAANYDLDTLILATGYDALTGALMRIDLRGRGGRSLQESWAAGPRNYLGLMTAGFPNLFIITGPGSPSVLVNMVVGIEQHVEWIAACLRYLREHEVATIEADPAAEAEWVGHVNQEADKTLFPAANSWYLGANVPGKPRVFMPYVGGIGRYRRICDDVAAKGYEGFLLKRRPVSAGSIRTGHDDARPS